MPTINYPFITPANYIFDPVKVEVVGGIAQLKLTVAGGQIFNEDFADDTGFTYDNTKVEFVGGQIQQKDITPTNSLFAVSYDTNANPIINEANLNWHKSGGSLTAVLNGAPIIVGNKLVCTGTQGLYYSRNSLIVETHKFKFTPNYTTSPPANLNMVSGWNGSNNDRFALTHSPSGNNLRFTLNDNVGGTILATATAFAGTWTPTAGVEYEFELVLDSVLGTVRVFIDGVLHDTLSPGTWTRGTGAMRYYIGASPIIGSYDRAEGSFDDYIMFSDAQHTVGYTPGYTIDPTIYTGSEIELPVFVHAGLGTIISLDGMSSSELGSPRYSFEAGSLGHVYWNGADWVASDGSYVQANDVATANTNLPSLTAISGELTFHVHVHYTNTNTQSSVDDLTVQHTADTIYDITNPTIIPTTAISQDALLTFLEVVNVAGLDEVRIALRVGGQDKYWDGATWVDADGTYTQTNDFATIQTNLAAFTVKGALLPVIYLHSNDGSTTPNIDDLTISFDFFGGVSVDLKINTVWGYVFDSEDNPIEGVKIHVSPLIYAEINEKIIAPKRLIVKTNSEGYWEAKLIETDSIIDPAFGYFFRFDDSRAKDLTGKKYVPDAESSNYNTLLDVA